MHGAIHSPPHPSQSLYLCPLLLSRDLPSRFQLEKARNPIRPIPWTYPLALSLGPIPWLRVAHRVPLSPPAPPHPAPPLSFFRFQLVTSFVRELHLTPLYLKPLSRTTPPKIQNYLVTRCTTRSHVLVRGGGGALFRTQIALIGLTVAVSLTDRGEEKRN